MKRQNSTNTASPQTRSSSSVRLWPTYLRALTISSLIALCAGLTVWKTDNALTHAVAELGCIFVALGIFFVAWYGRDWADSPSLTLGLGYLAVAMLDGFHVYYFPTMQTAPLLAFDLASWFWVCGRLFEACTLLFSVKSSARWNRSMALPLVTIGSSVFSFLLLRVSPLLPRLLTASGGVTPVKRWLEYAIVAILLAAWRAVSRSNSEQAARMRPWILLSISCTITSELCLAGYGTLTGLLHALGHSLKIVSYYFLFRGTFVLSIHQPFERLAATEHDLGVLLNNLPLGIVTTDKTGSLRFANPAACALLQRDVAEVCGLTLEDCLGGQDGAVTAGLASSSSPTERRHGRGSGNERRLRVDAAPLPEGDRVIFLEEDASVLWQRRLRLQAQNILNALSDFCVLVDQHGLVLAWNEAFLGLVGLPASSVEGSDLDQLWHALGGCHDLSQRLSWQLQEHLVQSADGRVRSILMRSTCIAQPEGTGQVQIVVGADVTRLRQQEARMRQEENRASIGQIAAGLVHEIRNPLTAVKGYNQLLGLGLHDARLREYSRTIQEEIVSLQRIISDLLEFSRPRQLDLRAYDLGELVGPLQTLVDSHAFLHGIELSVDLRCHEQSVLADKSRLQQAFLTAVRYCCEVSAGMRSPQLSMRVEMSCRADQVLLVLLCVDRAAEVDASTAEQIESPEPASAIDLELLRQLLADQGCEINLECLTGKDIALRLSLPLAGKLERS